MSPQTQATLTVVEAGQDIAPLVWMMKEARQIFANTTQALLGYVHAPQDAAAQAVVRKLSEQLRQTAAAWALMDLQAAAQFLRAVQMVLDHWLQNPAPCTPAAVVQLERTSYFLLGYFEHLLLARPVNDWDLFPAYQQLGVLAGSPSAMHPAQLWFPPCLAQSVALHTDLVMDQPARAIDGESGEKLERLLLPVMRSSDADCATQLKELSLGLAQTQAGSDSEFWKVSAAYFETIALHLYPSDTYLKRTTSRILRYYRACLAQERSAVAQRDTLLKECLFFCAQAPDLPAALAPVLAAVRQVYALTPALQVVLDSPRLMQFDMRSLEKVRTGIAHTRAQWAQALTGDAQAIEALRQTVPELIQIVQSLYEPAHALSVRLAENLPGMTQADKPETHAQWLAESTLAWGYLALVFYVFDPHAPQVPERLDALVQRLTRLQQGQSVEPWPAWMQVLNQLINECLSRRTVAQELQVLMDSLEQQCAYFFSHVDDTDALNALAVHLLQLYGVLVLMNMTPAAQAVLRMYEDAQEMLQQTPQSAMQGLEVLGRWSQNLSALSAYAAMLREALPLTQAITRYDEQNHVLQAELWRHAVSLDDTPNAAVESEKPAEPQIELEHKAALTPEFKAIGPLRIAQDLYNVYLNEADEYSRQLALVLGGWLLEPTQPLPQKILDDVHTLTGCSASVGFMGLVEFLVVYGRTLEAAQKAQADVAHQQAALLVAAAEEVQRLLHQFAAGFLKDPQSSLMRELEATQVLLQESHEVLTLTPEEAAFSESISWQDEELEDSVDPQLFLFFEEEAQELLPDIGIALRDWMSMPNDQELRAQVLRHLHTLKGSSRLAGAVQMGEMAHRMETYIENRLKPDAGNSVTQQQIEFLLVRLDALYTQFDWMRQSWHGASAGETVSMEEEENAAADFAVSEWESIPSWAPKLARRSVRVHAKLLDQLLDQASEVISTRTRLEAQLSQWRADLSDLNVNLERLRRQLRDIEIQAETQMQSRQLHYSKESVSEFDPLELDRFTRMQELTRIMAETVNDISAVRSSLQQTTTASEEDLMAQARQTRELQHSLLLTRMVEFESISERLYRVVRQACKEMGRVVRLDIVGGRIEIDRSVLERILPAFEHLLRNAVAHGIEPSEVRLAADKPSSGTITIAVHPVGNDVAIEVRDDGAGLNLTAIRQRAQARGLLEVDADLSAEHAIELIFKPGFSTAEHVSELAGRGIGMDVVRAEVHALGGQIQTTSQTGQGTCFKLVLPLTTAVTQVVMLRVGAQVVGVPSHLVQVVSQLDEQPLAQAYRSGVVTMEGAASASKALGFYSFGALLETPQTMWHTGQSQAAVVIFRSATQQIAVHVDEVLGYQEVLLRNLGPQLPNLPGLVGMSVLSSGAVALIYNPVALAHIYGVYARSSMQNTWREGVQTAQQTVLAPLVLVVDDSITVRRVMQRLLQREGYRVALAGDGVHALEAMAQEAPAVILCDIEMPRMGGFDLTRRVRADARLRDVPIIMVTSRMAEKHRIHAEELGVNHYLGKPYVEQELLSAVRRYTASQEAET